MMLSSVDLPEPDGPVIVSHSPRSTMRSMSTSAVTTGSTSKFRQTLVSSSTLLSAMEQRSSATGSCTRSTSAPAIVLVADDDELAWTEPAGVGGGDFDVAAGGEARRHGHVFEHAFVVDLDPRCA